MIDTGGRLVAATPVNDGRAIVGSHTALFDSASTTTTSSLITVQPDRPVMLVAYLMEPGASLTVEGVSVGSRGIGNGNGCCGPYSDSGNSISVSDVVDIRFRQPMSLGGHPWTLTDTNRQMLLVLPGQYILQLNDQQYLGHVHVEVVELGKLAVTLPDVYMAGVTAGVAV